MYYITTVSKKLAPKLHWFKKVNSPWLNFNLPWKHFIFSLETPWKFWLMVDQTYWHLLSFMDHVKIPNGLDARSKKPDASLGVFQKNLFTDRTEIDVIWLLINEFQRNFGSLKTRPIGIFFLLWTVSKFPTVWTLDPKNRTFSEKVCSPVAQK